ncbi:hypothetical protein JKF63_03507 [Porcisia hertigi]|uniref:Uncharacterized protein n=1 Tax=Porcisia hertigi TaxID=2761500 RepID=A0A836HWE5_9TRYP|nr:hypothetical protein JKF63_03507 [Porcisia hertigi]
MDLSSVTGWLYALFKGLANERLHPQTLDLVREMMLADTISDAVEAFTGAVSAHYGELCWDFFGVLGVLIVTVVLARYLVRFSWRFCIGIPMADYRSDKICRGKGCSQVQAQPEQRAKRRRQVKNGKVVGEAFARPEEVPQSVSPALTKTHEAQKSGVIKIDGKGKKTAEEKLRVSSVSALPLQPQEGRQQNEVQFTATSRRTPQDARAAPTSVLRGFPEVDLLLTSPGQHYLLIGCRSKRKTSLYPQSDATAFMERGKELQEKYFTDVNAVVTTALELEQKAEIYSAQFSVDDARLIIGERFTDRFICFSLSGRTKVSLTQLWSMRLPNRRLVSSVPRWSVLGQDSILSIVDQTTELEVITRATAETSTAHKEKFKVGSALAWAVCDDHVALGGSFLREPRLSRVVQRAGGSGLVLESIAVFPNAQKLRVSALAFVTSGAPEFNTRSYLIVFLENGVGTIYNLQNISRQNIPEVVCTFVDTDYAGHSSDAPLSILTAVRGQAYHEVLRIALLRGPSLTVYEQSGKAEGGCFQMVRIADVYDAQEGDVVKHAVFLQNGLGLATSGQSDGRHVRMFALPSPSHTE